MATEKQIAANRANSKRSTGPKTAVGKLRSSRNAFRHGLSLPLPLMPSMIDVANVLTRTLDCPPDQNSGAVEMVHAQFELLRIRSVRTEMMAAIEAGAISPAKLTRLAALDRYERFANTKRVRALRKLTAD
jgi:hypothetical protein